ncbi:MAG TPA: hypothetical protein VMA54_18715 [Steroidobacteraceae bacterium]|nr:hypothetical protein [Steroidobacteraceae bacterium]
MQVETLYHIPRAAKDITRVVWVALGAFVLILLSSVWLATEYVAWTFGWPAAFGAPMIGAHLYFPFDVLVWTWRYDTPTVAGRSPVASVSASWVTERCASIPRAPTPRA